MLLFQVNRHPITEAFEVDSNHDYTGHFILAQNTILYYMKDPLYCLELG